LEVTDSCLPTFLDFSTEGWALTVLDKGEMGRIDGKIGMGAAFDGRPFAHVARLLPPARA
jgi:hypothetical protein